MKVIDMSAKVQMDESIVNSIRDSIMEALPVIPKKLLGVNQIVREQKMPLSHVHILLMLRNAPLSIGELSHCLAIAKPNITPLVDELSNAGYVERVRDEKDRRVVRVNLTEAGRMKIAFIESTVTSNIESWGKYLTRSQLKELNRSLGSLVRLMSLIPDDM